jgi:uncharacterized membrane protein YkvA (DUF1232 family)
MTTKHNPIHVYGRRPDTDEILGADFFSHTGERAIAYAKDPRKAARVIGNVLSKTVDLGQDGALDELKEGVKAMGRMMNAIVTGEYKRVPSKSLVRISAGLIYFLFLEDIIRDKIPLLGLLDDAVVIAWVIRGIEEDLDDFLAWEGE